MADDPKPELEKRARQLHAEGLLIDGHNDLPWEIRKAGGSFDSVDLSQGAPKLMTDLPRLRTGGLKAQFWSVWIPGTHKDPAHTVLEQIDVVYRMVEKYPNDMAIALTADDIERVTKEGKVASLIGMEGGVAIENSLALLRDFYRLGLALHDTDAQRDAGLGRCGD